jgi:hypothetical protein
MVTSIDVDFFDASSFAIFDYTVYVYALIRGGERIHAPIYFCKTVKSALLNWISV